MNQPSAFERIERCRLLPLVSESDPDKAMRLADALVAGGLPIVEVALRREGALAALRAVAGRGDVLPIAGTVLNAEQVDSAVDAGAQMIVSPGLSGAVVERARERGVAVCPGVATPTDVQTAFAMGLDTLKFFPAAAAGGVAMLRALSGPFPRVRFLPTGGVSAANLEEFLGVGAVIACGGSWMVSPKLYADGDFTAVERAVREAVALADRPA